MPGVVTDEASMVEHAGELVALGQVSRGSAGEYQADERAGIARTSW